MDFSWFLFVGKTLLGFSEKEVGFMTLRKWRKLYQHYQNYYDFTKTNRTFREIEVLQAKEDEWLPD